MEGAEPTEVSITMEECVFCRNDIPVRAKVCAHCGRPQKMWKIHHLELASLFNVVLTFGLLILGYCQVNTAIDDRKDAAQALERASVAAERSEEILLSQVSMMTDLNEALDEFCSDLCGALKGTFDFSTFTCSTEAGAILKCPKRLESGSNQD